MKIPWKYWGTKYWVMGFILFLGFCANGQVKSVPQARSPVAVATPKPMAVRPMPAPANMPLNLPRTTSVTKEMNKTGDAYFVTTITRWRINGQNFQDVEICGPIPIAVPYQPGAQGPTTTVTHLAPQGGIPSTSPIRNSEPKIAGIDLKDIIEYMWSPDRTKLAYTKMGTNGKSNGKSEVWIEMPQEHRGRELAFGEKPSWSPTGDKVFFSDNGVRWSVKLDGTERTRVATTATAVASK